MAHLSSVKMEVGVQMWWRVGELEILFEECKEKEEIHPLTFKIDYIRSHFPYKPGDYPKGILIFSVF